MKKNFKIAVILMVIAAICGLAVSGMNMITAPIIEENQAIKEAKICQLIFADYDKDKSEKTTEGLSNEAIVKRVEARNASGKLLGYIYTVNGSNSYGAISLLVGIDTDGKLVSAEFLQNGQSYGKQVEAHVNSSYNSGLTLEDISNIDTKCGATFGAKTVKELVTIAFDDYKTIPSDGGTE